MPFIKGFDRNQTLALFSWDMEVDPESDARIIDQFVNKLDLSKYGIKEVSHEGHPAYDPKSMLKLYIYGYENEIHSSRKLAKNCKINVEVKWMIGGVRPDFRTISDFRKNNILAMEKIFYEFNQRIKLELRWGFLSVDGSKFYANNSKKANFTKEKLDERIEWLLKKEKEYLRILDEMDKQEDTEENLEQEARVFYEEKLKESQERIEKYGNYQKHMEETGKRQLSLTDEDARIMKSKDGFAVSYNPQTVVDSENHLIRDYKMTNQVTDHGLIAPALERIREENPEEILDVVADKGYLQAKDMVACLEQGIIPNVMLKDGKDEYELEISYEETETKTKPDQETIKESLHAGRIPKVYQEVITDMQVMEVWRKAKSEESDEILKSVYGTEDEMKERAREGFFVRDPERNVVYCPNGETLRQKCIKKNGNIGYSNKYACKHCPNRDQCYRSRKKDWREVDFSKDCLEKPCISWLKAKEKEIPYSENKNQKKEKRTIVKFLFRPNREKMAKRMCLSEHPFGTIKRSMGGSYFLLRGLQKVSGEFALLCLGYNIKRAKNLLGFNKMMELMAKA